jgi:hypothetical protein
MRGRDVIKPARKGLAMRTLNAKEVAHVSGGANPIVTLVSNILKGEGALLTGIFNILTFGAFKK